MPQLKGLPKISGFQMSGQNLALEMGSAENLPALTKNPPFLNINPQKTYQKTLIVHQKSPKILLPSAVHLEERLTVSQSVPEPASRQSDKGTQFGFFVSGSCGPKQQGGPLPETKQWPSGNAAHRRAFGRHFEPRLDAFGAAAAGAKDQPTWIRTAHRKLYVGCVTIGPPIV